VADVWEAPVSRNTYEWQWLSFAAECRPEAVPRPIAHDPKAGLLAMSYLPPEHYPSWKAQLMDGTVLPSVASHVGSALAAFHQISAKRHDLAQIFDSLTNFCALRIDPYFLATGERHPDLAERLQALAARTCGTFLALVHGDVSPKNILVGPCGPVFLDAECAWYGDPAFDLAFCLNHLLLKTLIRRDCAPLLVQSFAYLAEAYFDQVDFEPRVSLETRVAELLPALMLARVDGKSPVEYLSGKTREQDLVRRVARSLLSAPLTKLTSVASAWLTGISVLS